jgi:hypothetical protein
MTEINQAMFARPAPTLSYAFLVSSNENPMSRNHPAVARGQGPGGEFDFVGFPIPETDEIRVSPGSDQVTPARRPAACAATSLDQEGPTR